LVSNLFYLFHSKKEIKIKSINVRNENGSKAT